MKFDIRVAVFSLAIDTVGYSIMCLASKPLMFALFSGLGAFGGGMPPACQSLALSLVDNGEKTEDQRQDSDGSSEEGEQAVGVGEMFGAISVLQALGQNILGVRFFFPACFLTPFVGLLTCSSLCLFYRNPCIAAFDVRSAVRCYRWIVPSSNFRGSGVPPRPGPLVSALYQTT